MILVVPDDVVKQTINRTGDSAEAIVKFGSLQRHIYKLSFLPDISDDGRVLKVLLFARFKSIVANCWSPNYSLYWICLFKTCFYS